jgi:hypothetical protein
LEKAHQRLGSGRRQEIQRPLWQADGVGG